MPHHIIERAFLGGETRRSPGKTTCGLCSRLRRGTLYGYAEEHGFTESRSATTAMT